MPKTKGKRDEPEMPSTIERSDKRAQAVWQKRARRGGVRRAPGASGRGLRPRPPESQALRNTEVRVNA